MLTKTVLRTLECHRMVRPGDRLLVGLSGGPDSVALLHVLYESRARLGIEIVAAHLNHGLRDEASADEAFCRTLCDDLGVACVTESVDVGALGRRERRSVEDAARTARYEFLEREALRRGCRGVAVGHTLDDQAETVLMRLARGSGRRGLSGIHPVVDGTGSPAGAPRVRRLRPLLECRRDEVIRYLQRRGLRYREDASNRDRRFTRNRLRHDVLPGLAAALNPRLPETLSAAASVMRDEEAYLQARAGQAFAALGTVAASGVEIDIAALDREHAAIQRRVLRLAYETLHGHTRELGVRHVDALLGLVRDGRSGQRLHLPGTLARRTFGRLRLSERLASPSAANNGYNEFEYRFAIPSRLPIRESGGLLTADLLEPGKGVSTPKASGNAVVVGIEGALKELTVRSPGPSDRFQALGAPGSKPLRRYLMERRVAREDRSRVPLVVRADTCEILWVVGQTVSEAARVGRGKLAVRLSWVPK